MTVAKIRKRYASEWFALSVFVDFSLVRAFGTKKSHPCMNHCNTPCVGCCKRSRVGCYMCVITVFPCGKMGRDFILYRIFVVHSIHRASFMSVLWHLNTYLRIWHKSK